MHASAAIITFSFHEAGEKSLPGPAVVEVCRPRTRLVQRHGHVFGVTQHQHDAAGLAGVFAGDVPGTQVRGQDPRGGRGVEGPGPGGHQAVDLGAMDTVRAAPDKHRQRLTHPLDACKQQPTHG
jgi:hypothetical protein